MTPGVVIMPSFYEALCGLPDEDRVQIYDAIVRYGLYGELPQLPPHIKGYFILMQPNIDASQKRYNASVSAGKKGGRPKKSAVEQEEEITCEKPRSKPEDKPMQNQNHNQDNYIDIDYDTDKNTDNKKDKYIEKEEDNEWDINTALNSPAPEAKDIMRLDRFVPPTFSDVYLYCRERGNTVDAQSFVDYYSANGWRVGQAPMADWRAAVRRWEINGYSDLLTSYEPRTAPGSVPVRGFTPGYEP